MNISDFMSLSEKDAAVIIGNLAHEDMQKSGILASVTAAQFILESGYGKTGLAQEGNNCFGMKTDLSNNIWSGSTWDGVSFISRETTEQDENGNEYTVMATFRKYPCIEDSIADHSAYLLGAKNGDRLRYEGIKGMIDYRAVAQLIKDGDYATDINYVDKLCDIIERFNLTKYDYIDNDTDNITYRLYVGIADNDSELSEIRDRLVNSNIDYCYKTILQVGVYHNKNNALSYAEDLKNKGFKPQLINESEEL